MPQVSIVLPVRNGAATLPLCLDSIWQQSLTDFELIVIDDGCDDGSAALLQQVAQQEPRLRLLQPGAVGLVAALNLGIATARSQIVARMDADDVMMPDRLQLQVDYLTAHPEIALVASQVALFPPEQIQAGYREYVRWQNHCLTPSAIAANLYVESPLAHPSVTLRRAVLEAVGGYHEGPFPEDYELWLRLHQAGYRMAKLPQVLLHWCERCDRTSRTDPRYSRAAFDQLRARFLASDPRLQQSRELIIWGAGKKTRRRVRLLWQQGIRAIAWIDIDPKKIGRQLWGLPIHPPEWLQQRPRPFVLIYVTNHGARDLIAGTLSNWGYCIGVDFLPVG